MKKYMFKSKWVVFNNKGDKIETVTLNHIDGGVYKEIEPFEKELKQKGLYAHREESLDQDFLKGKSFKEKLRCLGWKLNREGLIVD